MLPVNEIFETVQGEAHWTGTPSIFIRLQGCDVSCPWCDTRHTWAKDESLETSMSSMLGKLNDSNKYAMVGVATLVGTVDEFQAGHVVITGGEPCQYDLTELTTRLIEGGRTVQIETSGTEPIRAHNRTWITVSPKIGMPGGKVVLHETLHRADEIKLPVGRPDDIEKFRNLMAAARVNPGTRVPIWLQPLSQNKKATDLCIATATKERWRISLQTHKYLGVR